MQRFAWMLGLGLAAGMATAQELNIPRIDSPPDLEDFVSMDPPAAIRNTMAVVTDFVQRQPSDGSAPTQRTDVYLGYDQRNLYAIFVAFDSNPALVRGNLAPREQIDDDDVRRYACTLGGIVASGLDPEPFAFFGFAPRSGGARGSCAPWR